MTQPPLTDRTALDLHRARAARAPELFLHEAVADDLQDRLSMVNRRFTAPAVVTPFARVWQDRLQEAAVIPDTETLELKPLSHDLVIHALGLHWANDPVGQLIQCRRALKPDGLLLAAFFGGETLSDLRTALSTAEIAMTGGLSPRVAPMADLRDAGALLQRAGLNLPVADSYRTTVTYETLFHLIRDLRAMGETNALTDRHKSPPPRALFAEAARIYHQAHADADGRIPAKFETIVLTGWAPDETQPKPLRPGSATSRLAEVLGSEERPLPDDAEPRD